MKTTILVIACLFSLPVYAQFKQFRDSIDHLIIEKGYNATDVYGRKQGFAIETQSYTEFANSRALFLYTGFFMHGKKMGVWEKKKWGLWIRERVIYLDTTETRKIVQVFYPNLHMASDEQYWYDRTLPDTLYTVDTATDALIRKMVRGKYVKDGPCRDFYEASGLLRSSGQYEKDVKKGFWLYYNEKGELIKREEYP